MSGNPDNASVWDDCDIFVVFDPPEDPTTVLPATIDDPFPGAWERVGLLDGAAGVDENVDEPRTVHRAWGVGPVKTSYQGAEVTRAFTVLEDNETVERLARPNLREKVLVGIEYHEDGKIRREITRKPATVRRGGARKRAENSLTSLQLMVTLYPDTSIDATDEDQFILVQESEALGS